MEPFTYTTTKGEDNSFEVRVQVSPEKYKDALDTVFGKLAREVKVSGFRDGKAPRNVIESKLGSKLFDETLQLLLPQVAADIVDKEQFSPVTNLKYDVLKMSDGDGVEFSFSFTNYPNITLADPSKIEITEPEFEITEEEVTEVIERMFHRHDHDHEEEHTHHEHDSEGHIVVTDEMVKELDTEGLNNVNDLRERIRQQIQTIKQRDGEQEVVNQMIDAMIKASTIEIPAALLTQETEMLVHEYEHRIKDLGVDIASFMEAQGVTPEKLREQKEEEARNKLSAELLLNEVAKKYEVVPSAEDIETELDSISDPEIRDQYDNARGRRHILAVLVQQNGIRKLRELIKVKKAAGQPQKPATAKD